MYFFLDRCHGDLNFFWTTAINIMPGTLSSTSDQIEFGILGLLHPFLCYLQLYRLFVSCPIRIRIAMYFFREAVIKAQVHFLDSCD